MADQYLFDNDGSEDERADTERDEKACDTWHLCAHAMHCVGCKGVFGDGLSQFTWGWENWTRCGFLETQFALVIPVLMGSETSVGGKMYFMVGHTSPP